MAKLIDKIKAKLRGEIVVEPDAGRGRIYGKPEVKLTGLRVVRKDGTVEEIINPEPSFSDKLKQLFKRGK